MCLKSQAEDQSDNVIEARHSEFRVSFLVQFIGVISIYKYNLLNIISSILSLFCNKLKHVTINNRNTKSEAFLSAISVVLFEIFDEP